MDAHGVFFLIANMNEMSMDQHWHGKKNLNINLSSEDFLFTYLLASSEGKYGQQISPCVTSL